MMGLPPHPPLSHPCPPAPPPSAHAADVWALGVIAYQLLTDQLPWSSPVPEALRRMVTEDPAPLGPLQAVGASIPAADFVLRALQKDPQRRPTAEQLRAHPWLLQHTGGQEEGGARFAA